MKPDHAGSNHLKVSNNMFSIFYRFKCVFGDHENNLQDYVKLFVPFYNI